MDNSDLLLNAPERLVIPMACGAEIDCSEWLSMSDNAWSLTLVA